MTQRFLLSAQARTLSVKTAFQMGEAKAYATFKLMRWPETDRIAGAAMGSRVSRQWKGYWQRAA